MKKQEMKALTEQWLAKHDPIKKFKQSPRYKNRQKQKLGWIKASKQKKYQDLVLRRKGLK